jgi:hypothetical protein
VDSYCAFATDWLVMPLCFIPLADLVASPTLTVAAQLAHDCLNSVPLAKEAALALVDAIEPYLEWQSGRNSAEINQSTC